MAWMCSGVQREQVPFAFAEAVRSADGADEACGMAGEFGEQSGGSQ
jgi:hypothetical protein